MRAARAPPPVGRSTTAAAPAPGCCRPRRSSAAHRSSPATLRTMAPHHTAAGCCQQEQHRQALHAGDGWQHRLNKLRPCIDAGPPQCYLDLASINEWQGDGWLTVCGWRSVVEELVALDVIVEHGLADVALVVVAGAVHRAVVPEHHAAPSNTPARSRVSLESAGPRVQVRDWCCGWAAGGLTPLRVRSSPRAPCPH